MKIGNAMNSRPEFLWWEDENANIILKCFINPIRFNYFRNIIGARQSDSSSGKILDVGCGGGYLSEEFAKSGFRVTGVDPSECSLKEAAEHATKNSLDIEYREGLGENLLFASETFDFVACCDVLEHVNDLDGVIAEISRVLKPGGLFFYDTINRTLASRIIVLVQDWKWTAVEAPGEHAWNMFVKPSELYARMRKHGLVPRDIRGISSGTNPVANFVNLRKLALKKISIHEMGVRMNLRESDDVSVSYMGYATKD